MLPRLPNVFDKKFLYGLIKVTHSVGTQTFYGIQFQMVVDCKGHKNMVSSDIIIQHFPILLRIKHTFHMKVLENP